ncbi:MAG: CZB domain-containing protein [Ignavibacteriaceae bacterium]|nr:CZB domain-containing protein [Ignavibacteriaceae bacterium]
MVTKEAIDSALNAHALWKTRLQDVVKNGKSDFKVSSVQKDNECQFGQWIYKLPEEDTLSEDFITIKNLHAEFHKTAALVLELALSGKKGEAIKHLEFGGIYNQITDKLVLALNAWKSKL